MGRLLGARVCRLEQQASGSQHLVVIFRVVTGQTSEDGEDAPASLIHPCFLGDWSPAERAAKLAELRAKYPGIPIEGTHEQA